MEVSYYYQPEQHLIERGHFVCVCVPVPDSSAFTATTCSRLHLDQTTLSSCIDAASICSDSGSKCRGVWVGTLALQLMSRTRTQTTVQLAIAALIGRFICTYVLLPCCSTFLVHGNCGCAASLFWALDSKHGICTCLLSVHSVVLPLLRLDVCLCFQVAVQLYPGYKLLPLRATRTSSINAAVKQAVQQQPATTPMAGILVVLEGSSSSSSEGSVLTVDSPISVGEGVSLVITTPGAMTAAAAESQHSKLAEAGPAVEQFVTVRCSSSRADGFLDARYVR